MKTTPNFTEQFLALLSTTGLSYRLNNIRIFLQELEEQQKIPYEELIISLRDVNVCISNIEKMEALARTETETRNQQQNKSLFPLTCSETREPDPDSTDIQLLEKLALLESQLLSFKQLPPHVWKDNMESWEVISFLKQSQFLCESIPDLPSRHISVTKKATYLSEEYRKYIAIFIEEVRKNSC